MMTAIFEYLSKQSVPGLLKSSCRPGLFEIMFWIVIVFIILVVALIMVYIAWNEPKGISLTEILLMLMLILLCSVALFFMNKFNR